MSPAISRVVIAFFTGAVFAIGLVLSGMTQPAKVIGFLNVVGLKNGISWQAQAGHWDPSLGFVMAGAVLVTLIAFCYAPKRLKPWLDQSFHLPKLKAIDTRLVAGAALFGVGWGLVGYCPGSALASVLVSSDAAIFVLAMVLGMFGAKRVLSRDENDR
jgi:uncharacterized protein